MPALPPSSGITSRTTAINIVYLFVNSIQQCMKHVEIDIHFVHEHVVVGDVRILHIPTSSHFPVIFTKGLPSSVFLELWSSLNIYRG
jgi:hypothetical protein